MPFFGKANAQSRLRASDLHSPVERKLTDQGCHLDSWYFWQAAAWAALMGYGIPRGIRRSFGVFD